MPEEPDKTASETTNARLNTDWSTVQRVIDETTGYVPAGEWPCPDRVAIQMRREADMYYRGFRVALIPIDTADMRSSREFWIRYFEAFDQLLPHLKPGEWTAIRRGWEAME